MKIVIDSNRVLAALIKESTTRKIIFSNDFEFIAPDHLIQEVRKYKERVIKASGITEGEFETLLSLILENIAILPKTEYESLIDALRNEIEDQKDIPYIASSLATGALGIWTHDPDFLKQNKIKIFTNIDLLGLSKKAEY